MVVVLAQRHRVRVTRFVTGAGMVRMRNAGRVRITVRVIRADRVIVPIGGGVVIALSRLSGVGMRVRLRRAHADRQLQRQDRGSKQGQQVGGLSHHDGHALYATHSQRLAGEVSTKFRIGSSSTPATRCSFGHYTRCPVVSRFVGKLDLL